MSLKPSTLQSGATRLRDDLDHVLQHTASLWEELRGGRLFITGGTGFFGTWLLESFVLANDRLSLGAQATVLTRDPAAFARKAPRLAAHVALNFVQGDVRDFAFPPGTFSHVIHAATDASAKLNDENPLLMFDTVLSGTRRVLDFTAQCGAQKFLLTSSGAVYGAQPGDLTHVPETYRGAPDPLDPRSAYGVGKRAAEHLCTLYGKQHGFEPKIARCFAFVGPGLPLDTHFAIGNFIRDALAGGPIRVSGDGTPYRSYLYATDLTIWLWTILFKGAPFRAYNVGSARDLTIAQLARTVAEQLSVKSGVQIAKQPIPGASPSRYVPEVARATTELGLKETVSLEEGIKRTAASAVRD